MTTLERTEMTDHLLEMPVLLACDFCGAPAEWNGPTIYRSWAYMCGICELYYHLPPGKTGKGVGQRLVLAGQDHHWDDVPEWLEHQTQHEHPVPA